MSIIAKANSESKFSKIPLPETGTTRAVCCAVWDLGLQKSSYKGEDKIKHKIVIAWEIDQLIDVPESDYNGMPYMLSKTYTLSLYDNANLRKDLESWRGKSFTDAEIEKGLDVSTLYGINCLIGITHAPSKKDPSKIYPNISSILPPMKGAEKMKPMRGQNDEAPKWVSEKQSQALSEDFEIGKSLSTQSWSDSPQPFGDEYPHGSDVESSVTY